MDNWLVQELIAHWVIWVLSLLAAGVVALWKAKGSRWVQPVLYGVVTFASCAALIGSFRVMSFVSVQQPFDTRNVESVVRDWLDVLGYGVTRVRDNEAHFNFRVVTPYTEHVIHVIRTNARDSYVSIEGTVRMPAPQSELLGKLSSDESNELIGQLRIEMSRLNIGYAGISSQLRSFTLVHRVPITESLTQYGFATALREVDNAMILAEEVIRIHLAGEQ